MKSDEYDRDFAKRNVERWPDGDDGLTAQDFYP
jgi:hypothetical protein